MKNPPFRYHRPNTLDEALSLLAEHDGSMKVLAGGQSLLPIMALRLGAPEHLLDISRLTELGGIVATNDGQVTIGAAVTYAEAERSETVARQSPLLHQAIPYVGHRAIRTRGTIVGSVAHADPAAEVPAVVLATGATMIAQSTQGTREIPADEFFTGFLDSSLRSDELLTAVRFPVWPAIARGTVLEVSRRHGDYAMIGLVAAVAAEGGSVVDVALSYFGVGPTPTRAAEAERVLLGQEATPERVALAVDTAMGELDPRADNHASANYRRHLAGVLARRALTALTTPGAAAA